MTKRLVPPRPDAKVMDRLERALVAAAEERGLVDLAYETVDSPVGKLFVAASGHGLARIAYADEGEEPWLNELAQKVSPRIVRAPRRTERIVRELDEFFAGRRTRFDIPIDFVLVKGFGRRVLEAALQIPYGETRSYSQVASLAGSERAYRAAGTALGRNPIPIVVPCHRVLHSGGGMGGYTGGLDRKLKLLEIESAHA